MTLDIRTKQTPFRVSLSRKDQSELFVSIQNKGEQPEKASLVLETGRGLGLDQSGLKHYHEYRMNEILPGKTKEIYVRLYPVPQSVIGENPFRLTLNEHYDGFDLVKRKITLDESVLIQK
ncbi:MAG: hypothetical protein J4215_00265 [Candidatus Diapherotrites archaeon]|uniref:Uncharacterized protein n=1 Tax=Candidatus Iainarchaeum sp. TaxID=3101447 RepID=A0A8T4L362_9ARCH|nr:hypothetical protein [Candidatus Diapherotrites archaeon]